MTKDIVSGDFYWITQRGTKTFIAAVDCTGHGVPGAFMSIIGFDLLKNIVRERGVEDPSEVLNQLNFGVSDTFRKSNTDSQKVRDGMDIALCVIDQAKHTIEFAGAMNPICLIRNESISLIKGNRFSIGSFNDDENNRFDKHTIKYQRGDTFYMYSDGYADQFGGPLGKKFKQKRFLHMLLNIHHLPLDKQKDELKENFTNWRDQIEQVDDVLVIGFKL
jgi:serine phosphatase RsbU (regulator of sigma subunit)